MKLSLAESYILKLLIPTFSAIFFVLLIIVSGNQIFLIFRESFTINFFNNEILNLIFLKTLKDFPNFLTLSLILSIIVVFSSLYKNSEAIIFRTAGFDNIKFLRLISKFLLVILLLEAFFSFYALPEIHKNIYFIKEEAQGRPNYISFNKRVFQRFNNNEVTIFSENVVANDLNPNEQILEKVFISQNLSKKANYIFAEKGKKIINENTKQVFLELQNGTIISQSKEGKINQRSKFNSNKILLYSPAKNVGSFPDKELKYSNLNNLLSISNFETRIELVSRISDLLIIIITTYISIMLGKNSSRNSKNFSVIFGVLIFSIIFTLKENIYSMILASEINSLLGIFIPFIILFSLIVLINIKQKI